MKQLTLRVDDELARGLKDAASRRGESVNGYASAVLSAAIDPDLAESELERIRGRLARAGLLAESAGRRADPPAAGELDEARRRAGRGRPLSDLIGEGRG